MMSRLTEQAILTAKAGRLLASVSPFPSQVHLTLPEYLAYGSLLLRRGDIHLICGTT